MTPPPTHRQTNALQSQLVAADSSDYEHRLRTLVLAEKLEEEKAEILAVLEDTYTALKVLWAVHAKGAQSDTLDAAKAVLTKAGYTF